MPYYNWKGIDWFGNIHKGVFFARSENDLNKLLLSKDIGLISFKTVIHKSLFSSIGLPLKVSFFKELAVLVDSGVLLPTALTVIRQQTSNNKFNKVLEEIEFEVKEGKSFSETISNYAYIFDYLIVQIIRAGEESGNLGQSLISLSNYLEKKEKFNQRLRSALILPTITFSLFIIITLIIFTYIIPTFSSILTFSNQQVPRLTQTLLNISSFLNEFGLQFVAVVVVFIFFFLRIILKKKKLFIDKTLLKLPFIGTLIKFSNLTYFLQSLSLVLNGGIHLSNALQMTSVSTKNEYFKNNFLRLFNKVSNGKLLSEAMAENKGLFLPNLVAMVKVGEETGRLGIMLEKASMFYFEKSDRLISFFLTVLQPILMIILGLLIALLIFAVYIPMFNLPNIINY